jgi:hypothetical protein
MCCAPAAVGEGEPENRVLKKSLAFGDEVWVITFMDEDVTDQKFVSYLMRTREPDDDDEEAEDE